MDTKKLVKLLSLIAALVGGGLGYDIYTGDAPEDPQPAVEAPVVVKSERRRCVFASFRDGDWVTGWGVVKKLLPDDTCPPCHQQFLLVDPTGETLKIAHNIDKWPRLGNLHPGDVVEFKGEFKDTDRGYLVHWTHPDPAGRKPGGYIRKAD